MKIADFGLSKDLYSKDYYQSDEKNGVPLPIKWLALESLNSGMFTTMSDVVSQLSSIVCNLMSHTISVIHQFWFHIISTAY